MSASSGVLPVSTARSKHVEILHEIPLTTIGKPSKPDPAARKLTH
jgi:hypothetical protein